jgi:hypothetical protein
VSASPLPSWSSQLLSSTSRDISDRLESWSTSS